MFLGLLSVLMLFSPVAWGQDLAGSPKWLRLGHYEKGWLGATSPFRGLFFLHPEGFKNPQAELDATIEAFRHPTADQIKKYGMLPQCFFAARFRWLNQELKFDPGLIDPCEERRSWKKKLNTGSVSLIFAAADLNNAPSTFGHTFLKLGNPDNRNSKELTDYGINYAADGDRRENIFYALKGLFGFYDGFFTMLPYHQKIREYTNMEGRDLWEYPLKLSAEEVEELIDHILEMEHSHAPYYFMSDNCSYQILKALEVVRPDLNVSARLPIYTIPLDVVKEIAKVPGLVGVPRFQRSLKSDYLDGYSRLTGDQREALDEAVDGLNIARTLSAKEAAEVYETAMKYYALKAYQSGVDQDEAKHKLSIKRAKLGMVTQNSVGVVPPVPGMSHDSSAVYLGGGENEKFGAFQSLKFRHAFHDLEQSDAGMVPFSQIEILSAELRYYSEEHRLALQKFTLFDLLNSTPLTSLDQHLSWRASGEVLDQWVVNLQGGMGTTLSLGRYARFMQFITVKYLDDFLGAGPNFVLAGHLGPVGVSFDAGYYFAANDRRLWQLKSRADLQLARNWDFQFEHLNQREWHGKLVYNFLF